MMWHVWIVDEDSTTRLTTKPGQLALVLTMAKQWGAVRGFTGRLMVLPEQLEPA